MASVISMSILLQGKQSWYRYRRDPCGQATEVPGSTEEDELVSLLIVIKLTQMYTWPVLQKWNHIKAKKKKVALLTDNNMPAIITAIIMWSSISPVTALNLITSVYNLPLKVARAFIYLLLSLKHFINDIKLKNLYRLVSCLPFLTKHGKKIDLGRFIHLHTQTWAV